MKITSVILFGAGYVLGAKAGRKRYEQIVALTQKAMRNVEQKSARQRILDYTDGRSPFAQILTESNGSSLSSARRESVS